MYSTAGHRQQRWTKHNPQQVANNQGTEAKKGRERNLLNYQTWKFKVWKFKLNMNFKKSASWWTYRAKGLIHFGQKHNFCEMWSCELSFLSYISHKVIQGSTAATQSADRTKLSNKKIQQVSFAMCSSIRFVPSTDTALSNDTRTSTKCWKVWQLTYRRY